MNETVMLWSQDYTRILFTTADREAAKKWFLTSGHDWLPIVIDYGTDWCQRWSGRIYVEDGKGTIKHYREYLQYMTWSTP